MGFGPRLSVIIPVYNGEQTLDRCLQSLLNQDYPENDYEILVVDNHSTDRTKEIIAQYPVRYLWEDAQRGPSAARNTGARSAQASGLVFFDADQIAEKDYLRRLSQGWEDMRFGAFSGRNIGMDSGDSFLGKYWREEWSEKHDRPREQLLIFSGGLILIRREVFEQLGGFDPQLMTCEDIDLAWRMQKQLSLTIKYNLDAVSHHLERIDLRSLLKREYSFGRGRAMLGRKHPEAADSLTRLFLHTVKRTLLGIAALIMGVIKLAFGKKSIEDLQLILLDIAMKWSHYRGRVAGTFTPVKGAR